MLNIRPPVIYTATPFQLTRIVEDAFLIDGTEEYRTYVCMMGEEKKAAYLRVVYVVEGIFSICSVQCKCNQAERLVKTEKRGRTVFWSCDMWLK